MIVFWDNELDKYNFSVSSEQGNFPASNLQNIHLVNSWRTNSLTDQYVTIDAGLGNTITPTCVAIAAHNLTSGATIKFQANDTDAWGAPALDETITYDAGIMTKIFSNSTGYRYCRFSFHDPSNPDGYIEIGRLSFGPHLQMPPVAKEFDIPKKTTSNRNISITGQPYGDKGYTYRSPGFSFPLINTLQKAEIEEMWEEVDRIKPVILLIWEDSLDVVGPIYCLIDQDELTWKQDADSRVWTLEINFLEVF